VLDLLRTQVLKARVDLAFDRSANRFRHGDSAWLGEALEARRDVDSIAVHGTVGLLDDVPQVHADAKAQTSVFRYVGETEREATLNGERRCDGSDRRLEDGEV
jgi:hypothetical protein